MDRLACIDVPALALQLLLRAHPDWRAEPSAVVECNAPQGAILWANQQALRCGVRPGLCYSAGLALCARLRAAEVSAEELAAAVGELTELLHGSSPHVEPCAEEPGVFWLDASGLARLTSLSAWAEALLASLRAAGFAGSAAVGFRRFGSYAAAKSLASSRAIVFDDAADEEAVARGAPLAAIALPIAALEALDKLGVRTVHELARLPAGAVLQRFGAEVHRLHRLAAGELESALDPAPHEAPLTAGVDLDYDATDLVQILDLAVELAQPLLVVLERSARAVAELRLTLQLAEASAAPLEETLVPAAPTRDLAWLARLLRLRLEGASLAGGVSRVQVTLRGGSSSSDQLALFNVRHGRDPAQAERAFSALRAAFGDDAVVRARPKAAHLPEASFAWERLERLAPPRPRAVASAPLVRRILSTPRILPPRAPRDPDGWMPCGLEHGPVVRLAGPYSLCGGWWREEVRRDYHFAELQSGELLWLYYDRRRRRWFLHGSVS